MLLALTLALIPGAIFPHNVHSQTLTITAVVVSKGNCSFTNNNATLEFGTLNPLELQDVAVDTGDQLSFICRGNGNNAIGYAISVTQSANGTSANPAMRHQDGIFDLPYELSVAPPSGNAPKNDVLPLVVTGKVRGNSYQFAPTGAYEDTATLTINP